MLNHLFTQLGDEILREQGTIDKFIGDAIMAFWNAPLAQPDHPARAAAAALRMREALKRFNEEKHAPLPVAVALGLATGEVCVGNIGSRDRFNYTVVGETVNQAARIEAGCRTVDYDILVARDAALGAPDMAFLDAGRLALKGVGERIHTFVLVGGPDMALTPAFVALKVAHGRLLDAITSGSDDVSTLLTTCRAQAVEIEPGLATFYDRLPKRLADFGAPAASDGGGPVGSHADIGQLVQPLVEAGGIPEGRIPRRQVTAQDEVVLGPIQMVVDQPFRHQQHDQSGN